MVAQYVHDVFEEYTNCEDSDMKQFIMLIFMLHDIHWQASPGGSVLAGCMPTPTAEHVAAVVVSVTINQFYT